MLKKPILAICRSVLPAVSYIFVNCRGYGIMPQGPNEVLRNNNERLIIFRNNCGLKMAISTLTEHKHT